MTGLTFVELLVVIAILGILAGFVIPNAPRSVRIRAQTTRFGNDGRQVVTSIISANIDREAIGKRPIWPGTDEIRVNETTTLGPYDAGNLDRSKKPLGDWGCV